MSSSSTSAGDRRTETLRTAEPVRRAAVVVHAHDGRVAAGLARLEDAARQAGVDLVDGPGDADVVLALGGDGTMLRALRAALGTRTPVFGVNFGRVGFLTSLASDRLDDGLERVFRGEFRVVELCTLALELGGDTYPALNDVVATSSRPGRMVQLAWRLGGEELGDVPCDGVICATPQGSTAYNLSNGGPVMMWGLEAIALTFVAPHSLHSRPVVLPRGIDLTVWNRTREIPITVLVDGHELGQLGTGDALTVAVGPQTVGLALLPEVTFFGRYREVFV